MKATLLEQTGSPRGIKKKTLSQSRLDKLMKKKDEKRRKTPCNKIPSS